jgi:putative ABC transport system permease protein
MYLKEKLLSMFLQYARSAYRNFLRKKTTTLINIIGMSIGIASVILIGNWVIYEYSFDRFHEKGKRIYRLIEKQSFDGQDVKYLSSMPEWLVETFEEDIDGVLASTALFNVGNIWFGEKDNRIEVKNVTFTNNKIFRIFTIKFIAGTPENALKNPQSIVITKSLAKRIFKDISPIGQSILYRNEKEYTITGVIEDIPDNSHFQTEMLVSIEERRSGWNWNDYNHTTSIYLLLKENVDPSSLWEPLQKSKEKYMPHDAENVEFQIQPLADIHLNSKHTMWGQNWKKSDSVLVNSFLLIGLLVLIISMINYINLTTASGFTRFKEAGLKKVIGSSRKILILQFLFESFLLIFISFWLSLLIIELVKPLLVRNSLMEFRFDFYQNRMFFPLSFIIIIILSILSGIYPALIISSVRPIDLFKRNLSYRKGNIPVRKILVITQMTIACVLAISVLFITKQMVFMQHKELGYEREAVVYFYTGDSFRRNYETIKDNLIKHASIMNVTSSNIPLGNAMWRNCIHFEGEKETDQWVTPYMMVDYNFFEFYNILVVQGRAFSKENALDKNHQAFLINESLAKQIGLNKILGKRFRTCNSSWGEIVGVLKDFNYRSLHHTIEPLAVQLGLNDKNVVSVKIRYEHANNALKILEDTWNIYQPDQPLRYSFLDDSLNNLYQAEERTVKVVTLFSIISIIISSIGLLGLIMFVSESRTKEIGIRKVNGASLKNVLTLLTSELMFNVIIAMLIAIPVGWYAINQWRDNFAYKTSISWWIFVLSGCMVLILMLLSVTYHTFKAARKNPVEVLRYE